MNKFILVIFLTSARYMTNQISFGLTTKFMQETIFDLTMRAIFFDLGIYYDVGWGPERFGPIGFITRLAVQFQL